MDVELFLNSILNFISSAYHSQAFILIKFLMAIYIIVLLVDIFLLLISRGVGGNIRVGIFGAHIPAELASKKEKTRKKWDELKQMLQSEKEEDWKIMIIKADEMIVDLIEKLGYKGKNAGEILAKVDNNHIEGADSIKEAHELRNRIIHEEEFKIDAGMAAEAMNKYEALLDYFDV